MSENTSQPCMALAVPYEWIPAPILGRPVFVTMRTDADMLAQYERWYQEAALEAGRADTGPGKIRCAAGLLGQVELLRGMFGIREGAPV